MNKSKIDTQEELINSIERCFGFKRELIKNPQQLGLWFVHFEVNGIIYAGSICFHGALPMINQIGYVTTHYYRDIPIEDWYFEEFIKGKLVKIMKCIDPDNGDWEDTGIRCKDQEEAKIRISNMDEPEKYGYDILD